MPETMPVIMIAKNAEKTVARCLSSLVNQTYSCKIIVVDGQSTDRTRSIVRGFSIELSDSPANDTYGMARNIGVHNVDTEIVAFLDADDYAELTWLERSVERFNEPNVGVVIDRRVYRSIKPNQPSSTNHRVSSLIIFASGTLFDSLLAPEVVGTLPPTICASL